MESNFTQNVTIVLQALENSLKSDAALRAASESILNQYHSHPNEYIAVLLEILLKHKNQSDAVKNASVQLKNVIKENWKKKQGDVFILTPQSKESIKENILQLMSMAQDKIELKNYQVLAKKIIKNEMLNQWSKLFEVISFYLNSKNNLFHIYCGLELFYLIVTKFEFELERAEFNQYFDMYHSIILSYFSQLSTKQSMDEIERKCYAKIIKILIKSCQISIPLSLLNNFDIVFSYILTYTQSDIKIIKLKLLMAYNIYQKYFDYPNKKDITVYNKYKEISGKFSYLVFDFFMKYCTIPNQEYYNVDCIAFTFQFMHQALARKDKMIMPLMKENIKQLISSCVTLNAITQNEMAMSQKEFIYYVTDGGNEGKRAIVDFVIKVAKSEALCKLVIEPLTQLLNNADTGNNILIQASCLDMLKLFFLNSKKFESKSTIYKTFLTEYIPKKINLELAGQNQMMNILCFKAIDFISIVKDISLFTNKEINFFIVILFKGISIQNNIMLNTISALVLPSLLGMNNELIALYRNEITKLITIYLSLIKEVEIEELLWGLDNIITLYPLETINYSKDIASELINMLSQFMSQLSECSEEEQTNLDNAACGIIESLTSLLSIANKHNMLDKENELLSITKDMLIFNLSEKCFNLSTMIYEKTLLFITAFIEYSPLIESNANSFLWDISRKLLESLFVVNNDGSIIAGYSFEMLQKIVPIFYSLITKTKDITFELDKSFKYYQTIIYLSQRKEDEVFSWYGIKLIISVFEMLPSPIAQVDQLVPSMLSFVIEEIKKASKQNYIQFLYQLIAVIFSYNPIIAMKSILSVNSIDIVFNKWVDAIDHMRFDFEYKRSILGLLSILKINLSEIPQVVSQNLQFLISKIWTMIEKYNKLATNKKEASEAEESKDGNDNSEDDYDDLNDEDYNEDDDEDYFCDEDDPITSEEKTYMEKTNLFVLIGGIIQYMNSYCSENVNVLNSALGEMKMKMLYGMISNNTI